MGVNLDRNTRTDWDLPPLSPIPTPRPMFPLKPISTCFSYLPSWLIQGRPSIFTGNVNAHSFDEINQEVHAAQRSILGAYHQWFGYPKPAQGVSQSRRSSRLGVSAAQSYPISSIHAKQGQLLDGDYIKEPKDLTFLSDTWAMGCSISSLTSFANIGQEIAICRRENPEVHRGSLPLICLSNPWRGVRACLPTVWPTRPQEY